MLFSFDFLDDQEQRVIMWKADLRKKVQNLMEKKETEH
jgi:hypothetical protein